MGMHAMVVSLQTSPALFSVPYANNEHSLLHVHFYDVLVHVEHLIFSISSVIPSSILQGVSQRDTCS
jgi:hypothetical protein